LIKELVESEEVLKLSVAISVLEFPLFCVANLRLRIFNIAAKDGNK
jgi:hypothetical protein